MAKKEYSLDYNIETDAERLAAVEDILSNLNYEPLSSDLEAMASYILYGKDSSGKNAVQRKETLDSDKRYKTYRRAADKVQSLDALLENPLADQQSYNTELERDIYLKKKPTISRPKYDKKGNLIDIGDGDVPGMQELWDRIDYLTHIVNVSEGKVAAKPEDELISDPYKLYKLKHQLVDMRRNQYYLKDIFKPTLHFINIKPPSPQTYNWVEDASYWLPLNLWQRKVDKSLLSSVSKKLEDYETRETPTGLEVKWVVRRQTFDWENPHHIKCLIDNYSAIYMQLWEHPNSWGRTLIFDFDRYCEMAQLSEVRDYILTRRIDRATYSTIVEELWEKYGIKYNENHVCTILTTEIPTKIAKTARKNRLIIETPDSEKKCCWTCKKLLPRDTLFFGLNASRNDGFSSNCKECEKQKRIEKGGQSVYDNRNKDTQANLFKM